MADGVRISVKRQSLIDRLNKLVPAARVEVTAAAMKGAEDVASLARRFAPKRSGALAASIQAEAKPEGLGARVTAGGTSATRRTVRAGVDVFVDTAFFAEFGTKPHRNKGKFAGSRHPGTKKHPFLFPAARMLKKKNLARVSRAITKAAKQVAR